MSKEVVDIAGRNGIHSQLYVDTGHDGDTQYTKDGGLSLASDYTPTNYMHGLLLTDNAGSDASGNIDVTYAGGGRAIIPYSVPAGYHLEILRGHRIKTIHSSATTTFSGRIYPLF